MKFVNISENWYNVVKKEPTATSALYKELGCQVSLRLNVA